MSNRWGVYYGYSKYPGTDVADSGFLTVEAPDDMAELDICRLVGEELAYPKGTLVWAHAEKEETLRECAEYLSSERPDFIVS